MTPRRHARQRAREPHRHESNLLRTLVPQTLTAEDRRLLLRHAERVRLLGGGKLSSALGR